MDATTLSTAAPLAAILFVSAYLQASTGFGLALVAMALVPLVLPISEAIAYVSAASFVVNFFIIFANRSGFSWREAVPLSVGMCLGIPIGYFSLHSLDGEWIIRLLGLVLVFIALSDFLQTRFSRLHVPKCSGGVFGLVGGFLAGAFNVGGPPVVIYAYAMKWSKVETVAILQTVFICGGIVRNALMIKAGEFHPELIQLVVWTLPAAALAAWLGKLTLDRLPQASLKAIAFALIFIIGLRYTLFG